jgi:hypothetical protein
MVATYLVKDKKIKELLTGLGHKIEYEYPNEWYFICTKELLKAVQDINKKK